MDGSMDLRVAEKMRAEREQRGGHAARQERLDNLLSQLQDALGVLEERLSPVLAAQVPTAELRGEPTPEQSQLASYLLHMAERAERVLRTVHDLSSRVDL